MRLFNFISSLLPRIQKDDVLEDLRVTLGELNNTITPTYEDAAKFLKKSKFKSQDVEDISNIFYRNYDLSKSNKQSNIILEIESKIKNIKTNIEKVISLNNDLLEEDIIREGISAKKAILVRSAEQLSFLTRFSIDLLNYVYSKEAKNLESDAGALLQIQIQRVEGNVGNFARVLSVFGAEPETFANFFNSIPDIVVNEKTHSSIAAVYSDDKIDPIGSKIALGFEGNPVYHLRLMIAEWQANRYKASKDKKRMLELRLLHLKLLQEEKADPKIEQEINYIQERITTIEYNMAKMEKSVE